MTKPHKHAALIKQWADDTSQEIWRWSNDAQAWMHERPVIGTSNPPAPSWYPESHYAIGPKPTEPPRKMCVLAGVEFPAPETKFPPPRHLYYLASASGVAMSAIYIADSIDLQRLTSGVIHLTQEAADQHSKALLAANKAAVETAVK